MTSQIVRAILAVGLLTLAAALVLLTRELARWRDHLPELMVQSQSWQDQVAQVEGRVALLQPQIDAALSVSRDVVSEVGRVRGAVPPIVREVHEVSRSVREDVLPRVDAALPRVDAILPRVDALEPRIDSALARVQEIERRLPALLDTANGAVNEVKRTNDEIPTILQEVRTTRADAEKMLDHAEHLLKESRKAGRQAGEGAVGGFFSGMIKFPVSTMRGARRDREREQKLKEDQAFVRSLSEDDQRAMHERTQAALEAGENGRAFSWRNGQNGDFGSVTVLRSYRAEDQLCRDLLYQVVVNQGDDHRSTNIVMCRDASSQWSITGDRAR